MKLSRKKIVILVIQIIMIIIINTMGIKFNISVYGSIILMYSLISFMCIVNIQKKIITPINILYISFILFQAGIPIAYCINDKYFNYYMLLFSNELIMKAAKYTLWSIETFSMGLIIALKSDVSESKKMLFTNSAAINNQIYVYKMARIIFSLTMVVVVPLYVFVAYLSVSTGFSQVTRSLIASNAIFNLARAFYIPSFFLLVCYGKEKQFTKIAKYIFYFTCILALLSGNRTDGILWLITYFYYNRLDYGDKRKHQIGLVIGIAVIVYLAVYIGQSRISNEMVSSKNVIMGIIGEMGFNFTSICFVMNYVPTITRFKYGFTYFNSILCMMPKSLDILHIFDSLNNSLPIQWLFDMNHLKYGGLLDFGVGFSTIAESYMNFANMGIVVSFLYALLLCGVFNRKWNRNSNWEKYIQMILFLAFMTFPRRAFNELINNIEYSIFLIALLLIAFYRLIKGKIKND